MVDNNESQVPQEKSGENRRPISHSRGDNQQKSNRECNEWRTEAGPFCLRIVWTVMMKPMKASARRIPVKGNSVDKIFKRRPGHHARNDQMEVICASQAHENDNGKRNGDEIAGVSKLPHHLSGQAPSDSYSPHWITLGAAFPIMDLQAREHQNCSGRRSTSMPRIAKTIKLLMIGDNIASATGAVTVTL
jgi:hypothetical protein